MKKTLAILLSLVMITGLFAGCDSAAPAVEAGDDYRIALIAMDRVDPHGVALEEGAMKAAMELGVEVVNMSPDARDDAQQIGQINNAVSSGCQAIVVAANGSDPVTTALQEAIAAGVKVIYVDSPANVEAEATFSTDNKAAGKIAGETMIAELEVRGIQEGTIGIININDNDDAAVQRETGFRKAFEGKGYTLLKTASGEGNAAKSQSIADDYITQGVVGIFGCDEAATAGSGNAAKADVANVVVVGFEKSDAIMDLVNDGYILATIVQNHDVMGYEGVKAAVAALKGEDLGGVVTDTGVSVLRAEGSAGEGRAAVSNDYKIALITMDRIDRHWVALEEGAMKAAAELGCEVVNMSPITKNDVQQSQQINKAVADRCDAIVIAANDSDAVSSALKEAVTAGVRIIYVDSQANVKVDATFSTDNQAAGFTAGETMIAELKARGITEGNIGIVNINDAADAAVQSEAGFREAFEGKGYTLLETQFGEGDAARSQSIAQDYITQAVVGIFGCNEGATAGSGNAVKATGAEVVCVGIDFGTSDVIRSLIDEGYILATVTQNSAVMGYEGVKAACAALNGENLGGRVFNTGVSLLTR